MALETTTHRRGFGHRLRELCEQMVYGGRNIYICYTIRKHVRTNIIDKGGGGNYNKHGHDEFRDAMCEKT